MPLEPPRNRRPREPLSLESVQARRVPQVRARRRWQLRSAGVALRRRLGQLADASGSALVSWPRGATHLVSLGALPPRAVPVRSCIADLSFITFRGERPSSIGDDDLGQRSLPSRPATIPGRSSPSRRAGARRSAARPSSCPRSVHSIPTLPPAGARSREDAALFRKTLPASDAWSHRAPRAEALKKCAREMLHLRSRVLFSPPCLPAGLDTWGRRVAGPARASRRPLAG